MLEVIDHRAVGDERERFGEMAVKILAGILAEEALRPRPRHELHGHGMDFARFHARIVHRDAPCVEICLECVAGLVCHDLNIVLRAVEIGKDERDVIIGNRAAITAGGLALGGENIEQLALSHHTEERARLRRELIIEFLAVGENVLGVAAGTRVAAAEGERRVRKAQWIRFAETLGLFLIDALGDRHKILAHGGTELLHIGLAVAVAAHAVVAEFRIALVAELFAHRVTQEDKLIVNAVKLALVLLIPSALGLPRGETLRVVRAGLERRELRERVYAALKRDLCRGDELIVFSRKIVFLLQLRDDLRRERFESDLGVEEHQRAVFLFKVRAVRRDKHRLRPLLRILLQFRGELVPEAVLLVIKLVARVDRVAHLRERCKRLDVFGERFLFKEHGLRRFIAPRGAQLFRQSAHGGFQRLAVGTLVGHFAKFQGFHKKAPYL